MCFVCVQANADPSEYSGHIDSSKSYATDNSILAADYGSTGNIPADAYRGLLYDDGRSWSPNYTQAATVSFSFNYTDGRYPSLVYSNNAQNFSATEQQAALGAMAKMSAIANITFVDVTGSGNAQIIFYKGNLTTYAAGLAGFRTDGYGTILASSVGMDTQYSPRFTVEGTYNYGTLLHEIGHAVGLKHPHDGSTNIAAPYDHKDYTIMSYNYRNTDSWNDNMPTNYQAIDVQALQFLYGAAQGATLPSGNERILSDNNDAYTITGAAENVKGGWGIDTLVGGAGNDTIYGGKSQADPDDQGDIIRGEGGNDIIFGNGGNDNIEGNAGNDTIWGGRGFDTIYGGTGDDSLAGGGGIEHPDDESDTIYGGAGNDSIIGNGGDDLVYGEAGNDTFWGGYGNDTFYGGDGNDLIMGQFGNDSLIGGAGNDTFYFYGANHNDTIADFTFGDIIRLDRNINNSGIYTAQDAANYATYSAGVAILDFGGGHVINVVTAAPLTAQSFEII